MGGFIAYYLGRISAENAAVIANEFFSSIIKIGIGSGLINVENFNLNSKEKFSSLFYSTGIIKTTNCTGNVNNSQISIIEGSSYLILNNNDFKKFNDIIIANKTLRNLQKKYISSSDVYHEYCPANRIVERNANSEEEVNKVKYRSYVDRTNKQDFQNHLCKMILIVEDRNHLFERFKWWMRLKFYSLSFCAGSLPDYVKNTKKLRNLASYEI